LHTGEAIRNERADFGRVPLRADEPGLISCASAVCGRERVRILGRDGCANLQEITAKGKEIRVGASGFSSV